MAKRTRKLWTTAEVARLRTLFPRQATAKVARAMRRSVSSIYGAAREYGIRKSAPYLASLAAASNLPKHGAAYRYPKGHVPANKGLRRPGWAPGRMGETQFRKGQRNGQAARHYMPVGAERDIEGWLYRKVSDVPNVAYTVNWKPVHHLIWEEHHGKPVPAGHVLRFKDGDRRNFDFQNFELITLAENMRRNTIHRYPPALKKVIRLQGKLRRTIERTANEKQDC